MDGSTAAPSFKVNELTPDPSVQFDPKVTKSYVITPIAWRRAGWSIRASAAW